MRDRRRARAEYRGCAAGSRRLGLLLVWLVIWLLVWLPAPHVVAGETPEMWLEVRSPHFVVLTDAGEKQGVHVADQFERMRSVFQTLFPKAEVDPASPIRVIAVKTRQDFQALEPAAYLAKGQLQLGGLFLRVPDKNYILLRLDSREEHPFAVVYHEYTHLLMNRAEAPLPLWLNEGLAEFFQNTEIHDKDVELGKPGVNEVEYLRQHRMLPLPTLLTADVNSPYYHEEQKGSVFYAEAWALTHYMEITDRQAHTQRLTDYAERMGRGEDSLHAAEQAFGDLRQLERTLQAYVAQGSFHYFAMKTNLPSGTSDFKTREITETEADAERADFLAYERRSNDARVLLKTVLRADPKNVSAHETMGYLDFRQGNMEAARKWYGEAVKLDSRSYLAHYYYAAMVMEEGDVSDGGAVEASLRTAIHLNPKFAPAYDQLAAYYAMRHEKLDEAHRLNAEAIELDPGNIGYRIHAANILVEAERPADALVVLRAAVAVAKTPEQGARIEKRIAEVERYQSELEEQQRQHAMAVEAEAQSAMLAEDELAELKYPAGAAYGPKRMARGVIKGVQCWRPSLLVLQVEGAEKGLTLYSSNYFKLSFSAANYTPEGAIQPCKDLEGKKARVQYAENADTSALGQILAIELSR